MKIMPVDLPDSYLKLIKKICTCTGINRSELVRHAIRSYLVKELKLAEGLENELEVWKSPRFFDYCINCEGGLNNEARENHLFHKTNEVFVLKFCCACYRQFKDTSFDDFPTQLIDKIRKTSSK